MTERMVEAFCPPDPVWRAAVVAQGEEYLECAIEGLGRS